MEEKKDFYLTSRWRNSSAPPGQQTNRLWCPFILEHLRTKHPFVEVGWFKKNKKIPAYKHNLDYISELGWYCHWSWTSSRHRNNPPSSFPKATSFPCISPPLGQHAPVASPSPVFNEIQFVSYTPSPQKHCIKWKPQNHIVIQWIM